MSKYYLINVETEREFKEGDVISFDMPPMCSGDYSATVMKDEKGLYIPKEDAFFDGCRDWRINGKYWEVS